MNCVNCGAPPTRGSKDCRYCETPLDKKEPRANEAGFRMIMRAIDSFTYDDDRVRAIQGLRGEFTAGQVIRVLDTFTYDDERLNAARLLVPRTINPFVLYEAAEGFTYDDERAEFVRLIGTTAGPCEPGAEAKERVRTVRVGAPEEKRPPWGMILLALVAIAFIFKTC